MSKIAIDPGHGGKDPGAIGIKGIQEKKVNWNVSVKLRELLSNDGYDVFISRQEDETVSLSERCRRINNFNPDVVISIHHNAGGGHGYDVIHSVKKKKSLEFALIVASEFKANGQTEHKIFSKESSKHFGQDYFGMLSGIKCETKIISEYAFLDSTDVEDIDSFSEQWTEAEVLAKAIKKVLGDENVKQVKGLLLDKNVTAILINGETFLRSTDVAVALGKNVKWDESTETVSIK